jgi:hypothetical protein
MGGPTRSAASTMKSHETAARLSGLKNTRRHSMSRRFARMPFGGCTG